MSMLLSLDYVLQLTLPSDVLPFVLVFYWIICGAIVQAIFTKIDKFLPVGYFHQTVETDITRRLFYFLSGGAILPMIIIVLPPVLILGHIGKLLEEKINRKNL